MRTADTFTTAASDFAEHGYTLLPGFLNSEELAPAQAELGVLFPTAKRVPRRLRPRTQRSLPERAWLGRPSPTELRSAT